MAEQKKKQSSKQGRNSKTCQRYLMQLRRARNKVRRMRKHCRAHPNDQQARERLKFPDLNGVRAAVFARGVAVWQGGLGGAEV